jgi:hypothetical protein
VSNIRKPDWVKWKLHPEVRLWQAVALWMDIEPEAVKHNPHSWMSGEHSFEESDEFERRISIAKANVGKSIRTGAIDLGSHLHSTVGLATFAAWAVALAGEGFSIPPELAALAEQPAAPLCDAEYAAAKHKIFWTFHEAACYLAGVPVGDRSQVTDPQSTSLVKRIYDDVKDGADAELFDWKETRASDRWLGGRRATPCDLLQFAANRAPVIGYSIPAPLLDLSKAATPKGSAAPDEPLSTKERNTALVIIAALAKHARIDISQPSKAANVIVSEAALLGARLGQRTVENWLKEAPDAIERRAVK